MRFQIIALAVLLAACPSAAFAASKAALSLDGVRVVDLTHAFDHQTIYWPTSPSAFELDTLSRGMTPGGWFYSSNRFCTPEHGGTHLDAPIHFAEGAWSADAIPVERFVGPAVVIDVTAQAEKDPNYRLTVADVERWEKAHGPIPKGAIVLMRTGWKAGTVKVGQTISIALYPLRDGRPGGLLDKVTLANGTTLKG